LSIDTTLAISPIVTSLNPYFSLLTVSKIYTDLEKQVLWQRCQKICLFIWYFYWIFHL